MLSRHFQEACSLVLPPLTLVPPGISVPRCIALGPQLDFSLFDISWYCVLLFCMSSSILVHFPQFWYTFLNFGSLVLFSHRSCRAAFFPKSYVFSLPFFCPLVLSGSLGRKCSCIWQVLEVGFPRFSHFGKKGVKECNSCRSRKMLQNEYLIAKIGFDDADNEPPKVWWWFVH